MILGPGCPKCRQTEQNVKDAVAETGVDASVEKVTDVMEIAGYGVFGTPSVIMPVSGLNYYSGGLQQFGGLGYAVNRTSQIRLTFGDFRIAFLPPDTSQTVP